MSPRERAFSLALMMLTAPAMGHPQSAAMGPEGDTSIGITERDFGAVQLTTADKSAKFNLGQTSFDPDLTKLHWYNFKIGAKVKDDVSSLFRKGALNPDASAEFDLGLNLATTPAPPISEDSIRACMSQPNGQLCISRYIANLGGPAARRCEAEKDVAGCYDEFIDRHPIGSSAYGLWLTLGVAATAGEYKLLSRAAAFDSQIAEDVFFGPALRAGINLWLARFLGNTVLLGTRVAIARENNADDLKSRNVEESSLYTSQDGTVQRRIVSTTTVLEGDYDEYTGSPVDLDLVVKPHGLTNLALNAFARADMARGRATSLDLGTGVIILKGNNALTPLGGIAVAVDDVLGDDIQKGAFWTHLKVNLLLNVTTPRIR